MKKGTYGYIYKTINLLNNKIYVGQNKGEFNSDYYGSGIYLIRAIKKYGKDKFKIKIIVYAKSKEKLDSLEIKFIAKYRKKYSIYNIASGGDGGIVWKIHPMKGKHHSKETKEKIRESHVGYKQSKKHIESHRKAMLGKHWVLKSPSKKIGTKQSDEAKLKMKLAHLGKKLSKKHRNNISKSLMGHIILEKTKKKISDTEKKTKRNKKCHL